MSEEATFGSWLKEYRKLLDLTQDELARRVGCSLMLIRKMEADERRASKQIAELLAIHLNIPVDERGDFVRFARSKNAHFSQTEKSPWRALRHHLTNLPVPPTRLFGREQEIEDIVRQIVRDRVRLLTLVGPPGIGKTRLAIACADKLLDHFDDGVYFITLAPVRDPDLVAAAIAHALGFRETAGDLYPNSLTQQLADKRILLVLDNFEQVVAAAPLAAELLTKCPWLQILVTSRVSLHVRAERQFRVAPLALPPLAAGAKPEQLLEYSSVQFFVDRAQSVEPNFDPSPQDAIACAQICARLDGLPLAIELVATRVDLLSPQELLAQIEQRLALLTQGPRDLPARHQTLRGAIDWSYDLLDAAEQELFARLAVFVGGWRIEMAHAICGQGITKPVLTGALSRLADSSLVVNERDSDGESRWSMLETIREYAAERLTIAEQTEETAKRHAQFFLAFAESAAPYLTGPQQVEWLSRLDRDQDNLHAALQWAVEHGQAELALRLGGALWRYWYIQGRLSEGPRWLKRTLELPDARTAPPFVRQQALHGASLLAWSSADYAEAQRFAEESHALAREIGDRKAMADALHVLANVAVDRSDFARAIALHEQNLALRRDLGDKAGIASSLNNLGRIAYYRGEAARAIVYYEESLALERELGDRFSVAVTLNNLGGALADNLQNYDRATLLLQESLALSREPGAKYYLIPFTLAHLGRVALYADNLPSAKKSLEESLSLARESGQRTGVALALLLLARLALRQNDAESAAALLREGLTLQRAFDEKGMGVRYLETMAAIDCARHRALRAATLLAASSGICKSADIRLPPAYVGQHDATVSCARAELDEQAFHDAWSRGRAMTMLQAFDFALETGQ